MSATRSSAVQFHFLDAQFLSLEKNPLFLFFDTCHKTLAAFSDSQILILGSIRISRGNMNASSSSSSQSLASKVFVGGITKELEEDALKEYFRKYGDVKEVVVVKERATGNVKGYGFVEFVDAEAAARSINDEGQHMVGDRLLEVKRARPRLEERRHYQLVCRQHSDHSITNCTNNDVNNSTARKIFVGGLPSSITEDEFRSYFKKFGSVNDVVIMIDSETNRPRGFGFITFDSEEAALNAMQKRFHELNKKTVEVKRAVPKDNPQNTGNIYNRMNSNSNSAFERLNSYANYHPWGYPFYGPEYGYYYDFAAPLVPYYGDYAYDGYSAIDYESPYANSRFTWNEHSMMSLKQISVPYRDASSFYPGYANSEPNGYMKMARRGFHGAVWLGKGKLNQTSTHLQKTDHADPTSLELEKLKVDDAK